MSIRKILNSLDNSWERDEILLKIKNGTDQDELINKFLMHNEAEVRELNTLLKPEDIDLLNQLEKLLTCEAKLINKIKNLNYLSNIENNQITNKKNLASSNIVQANRISLFMLNWSNKFVVIALITISAIALSKQAWT